MGRAAGLLRRVNLPGLLTVAVLAAGWEVAVGARMVQYQYLPAPTAILASGYDLLASGTLVGHLLHTVTVTLVGWAAASVLGVGLGVLLGLSDTAYRYSITSFEVTRAVPPLAFVPAAVLIFGFSLHMELVIVVYAGVWPLLINTIGGVRAVPNELLDVARMLRMSAPTRIRKVILPHALPAIVVGLRLSLSLCLVLAIVAEMVGNPAGLGRALVLAQRALQPERMFVYVLTTGVVGIALNATLRSLATRALPASAVDRHDVSPW